jgi:putative holliday junction resolvase
VSASGDERPGPGERFTPGVRVGVDVGSVRVGVAACDPTGLLASPVAVLRRDHRGQRDLDELSGIVTERDAVAVLVGLPRTLADREGAAAQAARRYAEQVARRVSPRPVRLVDERLSTVQATRDLQAAGLSSRRSRGLVDAAAAVVLLQQALDTERTTGVEAGERVTGR